MLCLKLYVDGEFNNDCKNCILERFKYWVDIKLLIYYKRGFFFFKFLNL